MSIRKPGIAGIIGITTCLILALFCNNEDGGDDPQVIIPDPGAESFGGVTFYLSAFDTSTSMNGKFKDGPTPQAIIWEEVMESGGLKLMSPRTPTCTESCASNEKCVEDDSCMAQPSAIDVGDLTVTGVNTKEGTSSFTTKPLGSALNYMPKEDLAYPPFNEGDLVTITATGSVTSPAFTLSAPGIKPIKVLNDTIKFIEGQAINLKWEPAAIPGNSIIDILIDIAYHGGTSSKIKGEVADNGSFTINADILDALRKLGISGFPRIDVTRKAISIDEVVKSKLVIQSMVSYELFIPNFVSCNNDSTCINAGFTNCTDDRRCE